MRARQMKYDADNIKQIFIKRSLLSSGIVSIGIWSLLIWDHYHGGVPSHHLLHRADLPAISNWWGGLLLPLLTMILSYRIQLRQISINDSKSNYLRIPIEHTYAFLFALLFGILLSLFFTFGYMNLSGYMIYGLFLLAFFYPIYRAECFLGFVFGMTFTFGAVLPTGVGVIFALIGVVIHLYVRSGIIFIVKLIIPAASPGKTDIND